jgi:carbohydrate-binding DOMON domain-containing protein
MESEQLLHEELVAGISKQMKRILGSSKQAVYIYLDDIHKVCNSKFATLLGYRSPEEWAKVEDSFEAFVDQSSQEILASAYNQAMEKLIPSTIQVTWKKKMGGTVGTTVVLVPIEYDDHLFALHFIS